MEEVLSSLVTLNVALLYSRLQKHETELLRQKKDYEEEIAKLK